jgi:epoxyqueuosine reductase
MDAVTFKQNFKGSPLERTKRTRLHRNVAIAMGNSRDPQFLPQLELWHKGDDPVLSEAARWALERIQASVKQ